MVFFTSIIIVAILYYLQADGLVYVIVIAMTAELINIFMTQTLAKSIEKKLTTQHKRITDNYAKQLQAHKKNIQEFETVQENSVKIIHRANMKIKELEKKLAPTQTPTEEKKAPATIPPPAPTQEAEAPEKFIDLPDGSNRNLP